MRVLVLGGTGFVGRHVVARLLAAGDEVLVAHRGPAEPADFPDVPHLHVDRASFAGTGSFGPDAVVDCCAETAADVAAVHPHLPADAHLVELSSQDVYRAYELMRARAGRGAGAGRRGLAAAGGTVSVPRSRVRARRLRQARRGAGDARPRRDRVPARDGLRRARPAAAEEMVLRRVRAGRARIPVGSGGWLWTRLYAGDAAAAVDLALRTDAARGAVLNLGEARTSSTVGWMGEVLAAAGHEPSWSPSRTRPSPTTSASPAAGPSTCSPAPAGPRTSSAGIRPTRPSRSAARSAGTSPTHPPTPTRLHPRRHRPRHRRRLTAARAAAERPARAVARRATPAAAQRRLSGGCSGGAAAQRRPRGRGSPAGVPKAHLGWAGEAAAQGRHRGGRRERRAADRVHGQLVRHPGRRRRAVDGQRGGRGAGDRAGRGDHDGHLAGHRHRRGGLRPGRPAGRRRHAAVPDLLAADRGPADPGPLGAGPGRLGRAGQPGAA